MTYHSQPTNDPGASFWRDTWRDWGGRLVLIALVWLIAHWLWLIFRWGDPAIHLALGTFFGIPLSLGASVLAFRTSRTPQLDRRTRQAWLLLGCGYSGFALGNLLTFYYNIVAGTLPYPSLADIAYLSFYPLLLWGLLTFPSASRRRTDRLSFWLDVGIVVFGGGMAIWYLVLGPTALAGGDDWRLVALSLAYPTGDLLVLFGVAVVALRRATSGSLIALRILVFAMLANAIADLGYGSLLLQGQYDYTTWPNAFWSLASMGMMASAYSQYGRSAHSALWKDDTETNAGSMNWLPYGVVVSGYGLLLFAAREIWNTPLGGTIIVAVILTGLVLARQMQATRNARAASGQLAEAKEALERSNIDLEQRINERTAELRTALNEVETRASEQARLLTELEQQRDLIREMSVPVLPVTDHILVMPLIGALDSARLVQIQAQALGQIEITRARRLLLDITGVPVVDTQVAQGLIRVVQAARLLGAEVVLVGIRPEVAQSIVGLGVDLSGVSTRSTLQSGLVEALGQR